MVFIETSAFSKARQHYLSEESFRQLQNTLFYGTTRINIMPGTGGLKKARWYVEGKGKREGLRVIFYVLEAKSVTLLLFMYPKGKQENLSQEQAKKLKALVDSEILKHA